MTRDELHQALAAKHGEAVQARFEAGAVAVCGLGGLGSNVAMLLARAGVGRLCLIDFDRVEPTNLNRQHYFPDQIGRPKAEALAESIRRAAPFCDIILHTVKLDPENAPALLADFPIVCECFDRADQKAMLVETVLAQLPGARVVAASGMAGLGTANTIQSRRVSRRLYLCGDGVTDTDTTPGLYGTRVAVCAAHQAHTVLQLLAGEI